MVHTVPERISNLKEELFNTSTRVCFERAFIVTGSYKNTEGEHPALRRAKALREIFRSIPIFIRPDELIVGQRAALLGGQSVYPEFHMDGLTRETTPPEIWDYWHGDTMGEVARRSHPERLRMAEHELAAGYVTGTSSGFGHVIVDYEKAINRGFNSIIAEVKGLLSQTTEEEREERAFLQSVIIASEGIIEWAERYAKLAEKEAENTDDHRRKMEILAIADTCRRVPAEPARNFREALQSFWFVHIAMHIEQYGWSISAGRFDQYMYPFFKEDTENGSLTYDEAWELLLNLWVKFMENVGSKVKDTVFQNLTLGGQDRDGKDQSNELSRMCMDATIALNFNQPALSVRWHPNIDRGFWDQVHDTIAKGLGMPALFNDNVIIPALVSHGIKEEDAYGYGIVGCVEASVPGKEQGMTAGGHINLAKALELALNDGHSMMTGEEIGISTGNPERFKSFEDLWEAYRQQVEYLGGLNILASHIAGEVQKQRGYCPLMSALLDDCIQKKRDLVYGGTRYNLPGIAIYGPSNVYDGLTAIKKWVFEEKRLTMGELRQALLENYEGHEDIRLLLANHSPRFGNDIDKVDELANRVNAIHAEFCWKQVDSRNGRYTCGVWPVDSHVHAGHWVAATPDGRHKGAPLVDGVGACQGADRRGPTALLKSGAKLNNIEHWPAGNTFNIKFSPNILKSTEGSGIIRDLATTFMQLGGQELQINVVSTETLKAAKASPEKYSDLIVRVAGYSAYFTRLSPDLQDEVISRMEQLR